MVQSGTTRCAFQSGIYRIVPQYGPSSKRVSTGTAEFHTADTDRRG
jgi:hypothetical protein